MCLHTNESLKARAPHYIKQPYPTEVTPRSPLVTNLCQYQIMVATEMAVLLLQFTIMAFSLFFNGIGMHTLCERKKGNQNQQMLLQNLAAVEMLKTSFDFGALTLFYFSKKSYDKVSLIFDVLEINMMTTFYVSIVAVAIDRLLCVALKGKDIHLLSPEYGPHIYALNSFLSLFPSPFLMYTLLAPLSYPGFPISCFLDSH